MGSTLETILQKTKALKRKGKTFLATALVAVSGCEAYSPPKQDPSPVDFCFIFDCSGGLGNQGGSPPGNNNLEILINPDTNGNHLMKLNSLEDGSEIDVWGNNPPNGDFSSITHIRYAINSNELTIKFDNFSRPITGSLSDGSGIELDHLQGGRTKITYVSPNGETSQWIVPTYKPTTSQKTTTSSFRSADEPCGFFDKWLEIYCELVNPFLYYISPQHEDLQGTSFDPSNPVAALVDLVNLQCQSPDLVVCETSNVMDLGQTFLESPPAHQPIAPHTSIPQGFYLGTCLNTSSSLSLDGVPQESPSGNFGISIGAFDGLGQPLIYDESTGDYTPARFPQDFSMPGDPSTILTLTNIISAGNTSTIKYSVSSIHTSSSGWGSATYTYDQSTRRLHSIDSFNLLGNSDDGYVDFRQTISGILDGPTPELELPTTTPDCD